MVLGLVSIYSILQGGQEPGDPPAVFGFMPMSVLTGSMEPVINAGDLVVVKTVDIGSIQENDIVTYKKGGTLVTHRVVDLVDQNGQVLLQTKGDANNIEDQGLVSGTQIVGSLAFNIPKGGYVSNFISSPIGIIIIGMILVLLLFMNIFKDKYLRNEKTKGISKKG
ncbi:signal peptidase [Cytobacillus purgationiresistens]|uniref:Signal peptidase I n=1 Tax=Cytobacillus purgationiresistens TaxID=863449 RepID=A0ABU0AN73_9BACI|nr:signal peptidase [Cytobacillus purgationiresistens]